MTKAEQRVELVKAVSKADKAWVEAKEAKEEFYSKGEVTSLEIKEDGVQMTMRELKVDADNAPEGYKAVISDNHCVGCAFRNDDSDCRKRKCMPDERMDKRQVIFMEKK